MPHVHVASQHPAELIGVPGEPVDLSWSIVESTGRLDETIVQVAADATFDTVSHEIVVDGPDQRVTAPGGSLASREQRYFRVRCRIDGELTDWSPTISVEAGLLDASAWTATPITMPNDPGAREKAPAPLLRHAFVVERPVRSARLYATSLGVHDLTIDGQPVSADLLAPGWTPYEQRLLACTYDVTSLVGPGDHVIGAALGDGWYRGRLGWNPGEDRCNYGRELALVAQLEIMYDDGSTDTVVTDPDWTCGTGAIRSADIYDGCTIDGRCAVPGWDAPDHDAPDWEPAVAAELDLDVVEPWSAAPIRPIDRWPVDLPDTDGPMIVDLGQNISGFLAIRVVGDAGTDVVVRHSEVLEADGSLHTFSLRSAEATDRFVLGSPDEVELIPRFTFHGFRYAEITTDATIVAVEAIAISSDMGPRSSFWCDHAGIRQLDANVRWSQRDNFVGLPTDCPQRDERLGWTGDAQAFAPTALTLFRSGPFWKSWLHDLALEQTDQGVPSVVPNVVLDGEAQYGRAGWADAATIVPWSVYVSDGDQTVLARQLPSMERWVRTLSSKRGADGLLRGEFQFGDWLDPDAPGDQPHRAKTEGDFLANAFFVHSADLTARAATIVGSSTLAREMTQLADEVRELTWQAWSAHAAETQTGCAVAIELAIAPETEQPALAEQLAHLVVDADGAVSTGFLGTPLVLPALSRFGHYDAAYVMLLRTEVRSWLYQVENGATTIWERWDAIRPDGSIHDGVMSPLDESDRDDEGGHMLSFNHYAYGAVIDWVYRHVGGIAPTAEAPGYERAIIGPRPCDSIRAARLEVESRFGTWETDWHVDDDSMTIELHVPFGTSAVLDLPTGDESTVEIDGSPVDGSPIGPGTHTIVVTNPVVRNTGGAS